MSHDMIIMKCHQAYNVVVYVMWYDYNVLVYVTWRDYNAMSSMVVVYNVCHVTWLRGVCKIKYGCQNISLIGCIIILLIHLYRILTTDIQYPILILDI